MKTNITKRTTEECQGFSLAERTLCGGQGGREYWRVSAPMGRCVWYWKWYWKEPCERPRVSLRSGARWTLWGRSPAEQGHICTKFTGGWVPFTCRLGLLALIMECFEATAGPAQLAVSISSRRASSPGWRDKGTPEWPLSLPQPCLTQEHCIKASSLSSPPAALNGMRMAPALR